MRLKPDDMPTYDWIEFLIVMGFALSGIMFVVGIIGYLYFRWLSGLS